MAGNGGHLVSLYSELSLARAERAASGVSSPLPSAILTPSLSYNRVLSLPTRDIRQGQGHPLYISLYINSILAFFFSPSSAFYCLPSTGGDHPAVIPPLCSRECSLSKTQFFQTVLSQTTPSPPCNDTQDSPKFHPIFSSLVKSCSFGTTKETERMMSIGLPTLNKPGRFFKQQTLK